MSETTTPSNLVPGSIWKREGSETTTESVVLFVTNAGLSAKVLEKNPQQVVFMSADAAILSMSIDRFVKNRTYDGMSEPVSDLIAAIPGAALGAPSVDDDEDDSDLIDLNQAVIDSALFTGGASEPEATTEEPQESGGLVINVGPHPLQRALESAALAYRETPFHTGDTLHEVQFLLSDELTLEMLHSAFSPADPNSIQKFEVVLENTRFAVDFSGVIGVMLSGIGSTAVGSLFVVSDGDFRGTVNASADQVAAPVAAPVSAPAQVVAAPAAAPVAKPEVVTIQRTVPQSVAPTVVVG